MTYLKKPYFVTMGTFHMGILLPFNNTETLSFRELFESTQLPERELVKQLQALVETKLITTEVTSRDNFFTINTFTALSEISRVNRHDTIIRVLHVGCYGNITNSCLKKVRIKLRKLLCVCLCLSVCLYIHIVCCFTFILLAGVVQIYISGHSG